MKEPTDKVLILRVDKLLDDLGVRGSKKLDVDEIVFALQQEYREYSRKKLNVFSKNVQAAYHYIRKRDNIMRAKEMSDKVESVASSYVARLNPESNADSRTTQITDMTAMENGKIARKTSRPSLANADLVVPTERFCDFGGNCRILSQICQILVHIQHRKLYNEINVTPPIGFLISGPPGSGKSLLARVIAGEFELPLLSICCPELVSGYSGGSENKIRDVFNKCKKHAPCVLFLDDIDSILQKRESAQKQMEQRIVSQFMFSLDDLANTSTSETVIVIGASSNPDSIDASLRRAGRFDREITLGMPNDKDRADILRVICREIKMSDDATYDAIASLTPGYVGADLSALVREACMKAMMRSFPVSEEVCQYGPEYQYLKSCSCETAVTDLVITYEDFVNAYKNVQPSAKREGFATVPTVTWDEVGALHEIRAELQLAIIYPVRHKNLFETFSLTSPPGILLAGPPGCGKTLLAKAVANEAGINFISVKGPELLNMYVGESERAVRQIFTRARNSAPCVIFFDELDALCPRRRDSDSGSRVVQQFLTELDGLQTRVGVFVLGATNRPDVIDSALLRPGRFDKVLKVSLPVASDRKDILNAITCAGTKPPLDLSEFSLSELAEDPACEGFSGADLASLVREASVIALQEAMHLKNPICLVKRHHFTKAFQKVRPSVVADPKLDRYFSAR